MRWRKSAWEINRVFVCLSQCLLVDSWVECLTMVKER
jgi:hypothetical protein